MDSQNKSEDQTLQDFFDKEKLTVNRREMLERIKLGLADVGCLVDE
jgi:hypothetical protein